MNTIILVPILLAFVFSISVSLLTFENDEKISNYALLCTTLVAVCVFSVLTFYYNESIVILEITKLLTVAFKVDGLSVIFAAMVSVLWPIATYYAATYMKHEGKFQKFFTFYIMTYGAVLGLAFSANMFTMYLFYETITFVTLPLVMHNGKERDMTAGNSYIKHMFFGAALGFSGMMIFATNVGSFDFVSGGITTLPLNNQMLLAYVLMFVGFAVKAGLFPFHKWLISAGVAPTTVTALLHAVAVVKSGAFAVMRLTYYLYDPTLLSGTIAQTFVLCLVSLSIVFGSYMAIRSTHFKRRLAYSTVSQLSYILLGVATMSWFGLEAALLHMVFHAFMKIVLFYSAGNVIYTNHKEFVDELKGFGSKMKVTFMCFTLCGLALVGIPPLAGFFSKYALVQSAILTGGELGFMCVIALIISAFFTAIYIIQILLNVYIPPRDFVMDDSIKEEPKSMQITLVILTSIMLCLSLGSYSVVQFIDFLIKGGF